MALSRLWRSTLAAILLIAGAAEAWAIDYVVPEAGLRFPKRLGRFVLEDGSQAPHAELGHVIQYKGSALIATVYVYDGGRRPIPNGVRNAVVQAEFAQAQREIFAVARMRGWPTPVKSADAVTGDTGIEFLTATYRLDSPSQRNDSIVAISGARGHYIKVRMTLPAGGDHVDPRVFLQHVGALVTGKHAPIAPVPPSVAAIAPGDASWEPPHNLARFMRSGEDEFPLFAPLGAEPLKTYPYRQQSIGATLHLYRRDGLPTREGATSPEVAKELSDATAATSLFGALGAVAGQHQNNRSSVLDHRAVSVGVYGGRAMQFQRVILRHSGGPQPQDTQVFLTAWAGQFLRVNFGYATGEPGVDAVQLFMSALVRALPR